MAIKDWNEDQWENLDKLANNLKNHLTNRHKFQKNIAWEQMLRIILASIAAYNEAAIK